MSNITNLNHEVSEEQTFFVTLVEPYNNVDDLFFSLFKAFPLAVVPKEPEALIEFKSKLEDLLNFAEIQEVDVLVQDRNAYQSFRIKSLEDFDYGIQYAIHTDKEVTPELPDMGNFWSIANEPFEVNFNAVYDNILDPIDQRFTARGDLIPQGQIDLPDSTFDQRHRLGSNNQSELRIVDRLSKYGESFPFLNEDGMLSEAARAEFEELLLSEANDEQLLMFLDKGIDYVKGAGSLIGNALKTVSDKTGLSRVAAGARDRAIDHVKEKVDGAIEKSKEKAKEKQAEKDKAEELRKRDIKELLDKAQEQLSDLNVKKIAQDKLKGKTKEDSKAIEQKAAADANANNAIRTAIEHKEKAGANSLVKEQESINSEIKQMVKELKDKKEQKKPAAKAAKAAKAE
jgi:hypothetical protein|nr:MAG TPA: hypothetical protein [Myoviridae sp. ctTS62]